MVLLEQEDPACRDHFQASYDLAERIGDQSRQADAACGLGNAYVRVPGLRDLDQAQRWHERDLALTPEQDRIGRAATHGSLANVAYERFGDARAVGAPGEHLVAYLDQAHAGHQQVLDLLPDDHHEYRATAHRQLGKIRSEFGDVPGANQHYQQAVRHDEARGNTYGAGVTRFYVALLLAGNERADDALLYARAALANFQQVGRGAASEAVDAEALIRALERILAAPLS